MLFIPETIHQIRRDLLEQLRIGKLTPEEAFGKALELDPCDIFSLTALGQVRLNAGDLAGAAEYFWRAANADSCDYEGLFKLRYCLPGESRAFFNGIMALALNKALRSRDGVEFFEKAAKDPPSADLPHPEGELTVRVGHFETDLETEPEEVTERLLPYRLIDDLLASAEEGLDNELVAEILKDGARCIPRLIGVLRAMATSSLPGDTPAAAVCSLALLGEIGDPVALPELIECYTVEDEDVAGSAHWAVKRIASRRPEESFEALRHVARVTAGDANSRCVCAMAVSDMRNMPDKREFLVGLLDGLASFTKSERHEIFMTVALSLEFLEGAKGREVAWSRLEANAGILPKRTRSEMRAAFKAHDELDEIAPPPGDGAQITVYDLCRLSYDDEDEDDDSIDPLGDDDGPDPDDDFLVEPVHRDVLPGRNDPCWCGSGRKYKKCHLESDEKSAAGAASREKGQEKAPAENAEEFELRGRLISFATETLRKREMEESLKVFLGDGPMAGGDGDTLSVEALDWMVHDYTPPRFGRPMIEEFLKRGTGLNMRQKSILEAWSRARFSIFEVQEVLPDQGVRMKDLLAGGELLVNDVSTSRHAELQDCFLARVEEFEGRYGFTAMVVSIPLHLVEPLRLWAMDARQRSGLEWGPFLRANSHRLRQEASRLIGNDALPKKIVTFEGDELVFSSARYEILDEAALRDALAQSKALHQDDPNSYGWLDEAEDANGSRRSFGHVGIAGGELTLECQSRQRLERGKSLLHRLAAGYLRHRADSFKSRQSSAIDYRS